MIYQTHFGYPDERDFRSAGRWAGVVVDVTMFQSFRASFEWLRILLDGDGPQRHVPLPILKERAEKFVGPIPEQAFVVAACLATNKKAWAEGRSFNRLAIKAPLFDEEWMGAEWRGHIECVERQAQTAAANN